MFPLFLQIIPDDTTFPADDNLMLCSPLIFFGQEVTAKSVALCSHDTCHAFNSCVFRYTTKGLELLEEALQQAPTLIELFTTRAKLLKHAGDLEGRCEASCDVLGFAGSVRRTVQHYQQN